MKKKILFILLFLLLIGVTGCGSNKNNNSKINDTNEDGTIYVSGALSDFERGYTVVTTGGLIKGYNSYIVNDKFEVTFKYNAVPEKELRDGYIILRDGENRIVYNALGEEKFRYNEHDYRDVELADNGCLIIRKSEDTYNSSREYTVVYDIEEGKEIYETPEHMSLYGDDMVKIDDNTFYNTRLKKVVKYNSSVYSDFVDGYSVSSGLSMSVFKDDGEEYSIPFDGIVKSNFGGMILDGYSTNSMVNLKTRKYVKFDVFDIDNSNGFNKNGYALLEISNGNSRYFYTVVDSEGNMLFEPAPIGHLSNNDGLNTLMVTSRMTDSDYFITKDGSKYQVRDIHNNVIVESTEGEEFIGVTNNHVKVKYSKRGYADGYYFKTLDGKNITLKYEKK